MTKISRRKFMGQYRSNGRTNNDWPFRICESTWPTTWRPALLRPSANDGRPGSHACCSKRRRVTPKWKQPRYLKKALTEIPRNVGTRQVSAVSARITHSVIFTPALTRSSHTTRNLERISSSAPARDIAPPPPAGTPGGHGPLSLDDWHYNAEAVQYHGRKDSFSRHPLRLSQPCP